MTRHGTRTETRARQRGVGRGEFPSVPDDVARKTLAGGDRGHSRLDEFPKSTIAALNGLAIGGGLVRAACCDIRIAGADAQLGGPEVKLASSPGARDVPNPRRVGEAPRSRCVHR